MRRPLGWIRRHQMMIGYVILAVGVAIAFTAFRVDLNNRRDARREQDRQLCLAIPGAAAAAAQALVDVLVADAQSRGTDPAKIEATQRLGALYVTRAQAIALGKLPYCKRIGVTLGSLPPT